MSFMDVLVGWLTGDMGFMAVLLWFVQQFMAAQ